MMTRILFIFCLILASCSSVEVSPRHSVKPIIFSVANDTHEFGAGVVIKKGWLITAGHFFPDDDILKSIDIITSQGIVSGTIIKVDKEVDLALLKANVSCPCAKLATHEPALDTHVFTIGYPYGPEINSIQIVTEGTFQGMHVYREGRPVRIITTASIAMGSSGGGVFIKEHESYKLIAITVGIFETIRPYGYPRLEPWIALSVPFTTIKTFLKGTPLENDLDK